MDPRASTCVQTPAEPRPSLPTLDRESFFQFPSGYVHGANESSGHDFGTSIARVAREPMPAPTLGAGDKLTQDGPETEPSCALEPLKTNLQSARAVRPCYICPGAHVPEIFLGDFQSDGSTKYNGETPVDVPNFCNV